MRQPRATNRRFGATSASLNHESAHGLTLAAMLAIAALASPQLATAQAKTKIFVAPYQSVQNAAPTDIAKQTTELIRGEISAMPDAELIAPPEGEYQSVEGVAEESPLPVINRDKEIAAAEATYQKAIALQNDKKFAEASTKFQQAISEYERALDGFTDFGRIADIYLRLAVCYYRSGKQGEGAMALESLARVMPTYKIDESAYPEPFVREVKDIRKRTMTAARGTLLVTSQPSGAKVLLNGRELGMTPLRITELMRGDHYLRVEGAAGAIEARKVQAFPSREEKAEFTFGAKKAETGGTPMARLEAKLKANMIDMEARELAQNIGRKNGAAYVVIGGVGAGPAGYRVHSYIVSVDNATMAALTPLDFDTDMLQASLEVFKLSGDVQTNLAGIQNPVTQSITQVVPGAAAGAGGAVGEAEPPTDVVGQPPYVEEAPAPAAFAAAPAPSGPATVGALAGAPVMSAPAPAPGPAPVAQQQPSYNTNVFSQLNAPPPGAADQVPVDIEYVPVYKKWWFWVIIGAVVAGGATAGVILLQPGAPENATGTVTAR